ncbi:hypothetical protein H6P81_021254 [Aristolochia fimbriata]|uniref:Uncharacterized protein n=1 Tax=Aristolochia fimbriata TaxID=158543 RepID=A0AAV7DS55_ARIFI|nr:hypothetical protein H6P81_021254 [Aristolochia fimbriata]
MVWSCCPENLNSSVTRGPVPAYQLGLGCPIEPLGTGFSPRASPHGRLPPGFAPANQDSFECCMAKGQSCCRDALLTPRRFRRYTAGVVAWSRWVFHALVEMLPSPSRQPPGAASRSLLPGRYSRRRIANRSVKSWPNVFEMSAWWTTPGAAALFELQEAPDGSTMERRRILPFLARQTKSPGSSSREKPSQTRTSHTGTTSVPAAMTRCESVGLYAGRWKLLTIHAFRAVGALIPDSALGFTV